MHRGNQICGVKISLFGLVFLTQLVHLVTRGPDRKTGSLAQDVEDKERQNIAHILVTGLPSIH